MPIDLLAIAADLIAGEGLELVKDKAKRQEGVLRILSKLGFSLDVPPANDFDGVYVYTLVIYGIDKPKPILEFFRHEFIKRAFRKSFEQRNSSVLEDETENFLDWNELGKDFRAIDYDPRREFTEFQEQFITAAKLTRTVQEVIVDQKLDDFSDKLSGLPTKDYLDIKFEPIYKKLNEQASSETTIQESDSTVEFSLPSTLFFVGQEDALEHLTKGIASSNVVMIGGIAGIGKTYLVAHFVEIQTDTKPVLWQDCSTSNQLEQVLLSLSEFFKAQFDDIELWQLLRNPLANEHNKLSAVAKVMDKYQCFLVWDNFDARINQPLIPLLLTLNKLLRQGKLIITTREFFEITEAFNPIFQYVVPSMSPEVGLDLMKAYLKKLGLPDEPDDLLMDAYERVGGHPYFMSRLIILSVTLPIRELVNSLPQLSTETHKYIQERVSNQLDQDTRKLLQYLSIIRKPFQMSAIDSVAENTVPKFDQLTKKFLVTKVSKSSSFYEIHDLVKEFELSHLTPADRIAAHINAAKYYANLEKRTFFDGAELVGHLIEGEKYKVAEKISNNLLSSALHTGLFDFAIDFSNQLIEENAFEEWGQIYFLRGRAFRLKGEINNALECYRAASQKTNDDFMRDAAQIEESSMLFLSEKDSEITEAIRILSNLVKSDKIQTRIQALTSLGYVNIKSKKTRKKGLLQLQEALSLAEVEGLHRNIMQICHSLGDAYLQKNQMKKALEYLERARTMREEVSAEYGEIDLEADYHLFKSLEDVYRNLGRYDDATNAASICMHIDRKHNFRDRLALSLYNLGEELCVLRDYKAAQQVLSESLDLIRTQNLGTTAEQLTTELLIVANWYLNQFEYAVELILEYILVHMNENNFAGKHVIMQENDMSLPEGVEHPQFVNMGGNMLHLLVLPKEFSYEDVKQWHENVLTRRPELTPAYNPVLLFKKNDE